MEAVKKRERKEDVSPRQKRLGDLIIKKTLAGDDFTKRDVLREAGYSEATANGNPARVMTSESLRAYLADHGLGEDKVKKVLAEAMEAKAQAQFHGEVIESDAPDHTTRLRALSLMGDFSGLKSVNVKQTNVNVNLSGEDVRSLLGFN